MSDQCLHERRFFERQNEGQKLTDERPIRTHHKNKECAEETTLGEKKKKTNTPKQIHEGREVKHAVKLCLHWVIQHDVRRTSTIKETT